MSAEINRKFPWYGWLGMILILLFWYLNWFLTGLRTHWGFFPLWLGFCLTIDAVVYVRKGTSLIKRSVAKYVLLFLISIPVWWLFELFNSITKNWFYDGKEYFTDLEFFLLASLSFSTVIPAVFETSELAGTFRLIRNIKKGPRIKPIPLVLALFIILGLITLALEILFPAVFYPFIWLTVYFLIEPVNCKMRFRNLLTYTKERDWRPVMALWAGCLACGAFWEMWNFYSYPKWFYQLPGIESLHIFEMPLPGYLGYLSFSLELFAVYHLITGLFGDRSDYIKLI